MVTLRGDLYCADPWHNSLICRKPMHGTEPAAASFVGPDEVSPEKGIRLLMGELAKEILPVNI
ncbi:hypothetical protein, partial [Pseudomonas laurylsulfatiphila]|uniref:hypothetical protein n=1 Tax=Pseudomonas laurylsulfatiphila TaxID=2011015 RepID=UPI003D0B6CA3